MLVATRSCRHDALLLRSPMCKLRSRHDHICHIEGWHNRLKRISRKAHPNLYEVLELFQREEAASRVTVIQLEAGGARKAKRRKVVQREERIQALKDELCVIVYYIRGKEI